MEKPKILIRLTAQLRGKGDRNPSVNALRYLRNFGIIEKNSLKLTPKGKIRNEMSPGERAKERQARYTGNEVDDYNYDKKTNQATLKHGKKYK
jgi:hypothetical protein